MPARRCTLRSQRRMTTGWTIVWSLDEVFFYDESMRFFLVILIALFQALPQLRSVVVISHRGEHLLHPENTIPAYRAAFAAGADFIETDVRTTADGRMVVMHDATVDRCTDGRGEVVSMQFAEVIKLDAGAKFG